MAPKARKGPQQEAEPEREPVRVGPTLVWLLRDAATAPYVACPSGRAYSTIALGEGRLYVFGGWNGALRPPSTKPSASMLSSIGAMCTPRSIISPAHSSRLPTAELTSRPHHREPQHSHGTGGGLVHPGHCREITAFDFHRNAWAIVDNCSGDPHPGTSQAAGADLGGAVLLFGGWDGFRRHSALTLYSLQEDRWKPFPTVGDVAPPALSFHACCGYGRRFFVLGGEAADGPLGDMYVLDLTTTAWSIAPSAGMPPKRSAHTMTVLQGLYVVVFGGRGADGAALGDVAIFDISNNHWVLGLRVQGVGPARYGHSACAIAENKILIIGGMGPRACAPPATAPASNAKADRQSERDRDAAQMLALQAALASYELHADAWILTLVRPGVVSWERAQLCGSADHSQRAPTPQVQMVRSQSVSASEPGTPQVPEMPARTPSVAASTTSLQAALAAPLPAAQEEAAPLHVAVNAPLPAGRCGHAAVAAGNTVYVFGGRTDEVTGVTSDLLVLDITAALPQPLTPEADKMSGNRVESESGMRAPSSLISQ